MARPKKRILQSVEKPGADLLAYGRSVLASESDAVRSVAPRLGDSFVRAVEMVLACKSRVVITGIGKPGFIAQKISATFASTGTPSLYLHPAEALHGDLGRLGKDDILLALSNSGETDEILQLLPAVRRLGAAIVAVTGDARSSLARGADVVIDIGPVEEACPMGLAPTTSSACLLAVGDALAMTVLWRRPFREQEFALYHPAGELGRQLLRVEDVMRKGTSNPVVEASAPLARAVVVMTETQGRPGATSVVDGAGKLVGIFTDGDLRRLVEKGQIDFTRPVSSAMGKNPRVARPEMPIAQAAALMREARIDQVPVVDAEHKPVGLLDVQDLLAAKVL